MKNKIDREKIDNFFQNILDNTDSKKKKDNLKIVYDILLHLYETGSNNFSIALIGKLSKKEGGPITQTIRNAQGKDYKDLIEFFVNNITISDNYKENSDYKLSDYIDDPALKAHINIIISENKSLKNQLNILKNNMNKNYELNYHVENNINNSSTDTSNNTLLSSEIESITKFIKDIENNSISIKLTDIGSLKDENDILIANPGFFDGLKKIILM
ncbi:gamma-mobile-trio protein GmtX [Aliarcobacter butzleri]|uniref:Gamma-mobile-trio protein GmtX n=1 Tax=Aliarcobacter butzleri TaxID=28197 RepID=A0AAW7Q703_9BACT|nr:gamma-mobile-trio protein GmtX [Aliarcobacter butzleri]MDN5114883.1 gamma-mobile-trio protein GmtX [Aliarcobacter butzleri]